MASSAALNLRLVFEGKKYLIERFPNTRNELLIQAIEKLKLAPGKDYMLQYLETETERIVITDDSDLTVVKSLALSENRRVVQVSVERIDDKGFSYPRNSSSTGLPTFASNICQSFDPVKYYEYLKNKIPSINEEFEAAMLKGVPCEECLGMKKFRGRKCENCYGKGFRPMTPSSQLMLKLIDYKIREYVMGPLESYCSKYKEEEAENPSPPIEKLANGGPSPKGAAVNNILIEPVPSCDASMIKERQSVGGLRPVPKRGEQRLSEGIGKVKFIKGNPNQHPPRKSSSRDDLNEIVAKSSAQL